MTLPRPLEAGRHVLVPKIRKTYMAMQERNRGQQPGGDMLTAIYSREHYFCFCFCFINVGRVPVRRVNSVPLAQRGPWRSRCPPSREPSRRLGVHRPEWRGDHVNVGGAPDSRSVALPTIATGDGSGPDRLGRPGRRTACPHQAKLAPARTSSSWLASPRRGYPRATRRRRSFAAIRGEPHTGERSHQGRTAHWRTFASGRTAKTWRRTHAPSCRLPPSAGTPPRPLQKEAGVLASNCGG
jgi:hypothetical protein